MRDHNKPAMNGAAEYDDEVLDAGWVPPESMGLPPKSRAPLGGASRVEEFLDIVYRSQGSDTVE